MGTSLDAVITVGVDIGGTKIAAAAVDEKGEVVARSRRDTPEEHAAAILHTVAEMVRELAASTEVGAVGVAAAGFVDSARSSVVFAPNLPWRDEPLRDLLQAEVDLPVVIENDANAAAWGEFRFGAGARGRRHGAGDDRHRHRRRRRQRRHAAARRLRDGRRDRPPARRPGRYPLRLRQPGLLGAVRSAAPSRAARELATSEPQRYAALLEAAGGSAADVEGEMVTAAAEAGDEAAAALMTAFGTEFGETLASLVAVLDPELVVIGGGASRGGRPAAAPDPAGVRRGADGPGAPAAARVMAAQLGNDAGMIGAADLARDVLPGGRAG